MTRLQFVGKKAEFVSAGGDHLVKMFSATNGGTTKTFTGANDFIYAIGVNPEGTVVVTGGEEGIVRVYNGATAAVQKTLMPPGEEPKEKEHLKK